MKYYEELWWEIVERQLDQTLNEYTIEELTNDPILQGWESFEGVPLLEDLETGERFYYVATYWEQGVDGYDLEPVGEAV